MVSLLKSNRHIGIPVAQVQNTYTYMCIMVMIMMAISQISNGQLKYFYSVF